MATAVVPSQGHDLCLTVFGMLLSDTVRLKLPWAVKEDAAGGAENRMVVRDAHGLSRRTGTGALPCLPTNLPVCYALQGRSIIGEERC